MQILAHSQADTVFMVFASGLLSALSIISLVWVAILSVLLILNAIKEGQRKAEGSDAAFVFVTEFTGLNAGQSAGVIASYALGFASVLYLFG